MKCLIRLAQASALAVAVAFILASPAEKAVLAGETEAFTIESFAISNGGGISSNAEFRVTGIIGQPAAGRSASGQFQLDAGFFRVIELDLPAGPVTLTFTMQGAQLKISWPASGTEGFILEQTADLSGQPDWQPAAESPALEGDLKSALVPLANGNRFYRLRLQ